MLKKLFVAVSLLIVSGTAGQALAADIIYVWAVPTGTAGTWEIRAKNLVDVSGVDLTVTYDKAAYREAAGSWAISGGMGAVNAKNIPGTIRMAIVSTALFGAPGVSTVGHVTLTPVNAGVTPRPSLTGSVVPAAPIVFHEPPAELVITGLPSGPGGTSTKEVVGTLSPASVSGPNYPGTINFDTIDPYGDEKKREQVALRERERQRESVDLQQATPGTPPPVKPEPVKEPVPEAKPAKPEGEKFIALKGALQRFKEFDGEWTDENLMALLAFPAPEGFRQEPPIGLSDGTKIVTIHIAGKPDQQTPNFVLKGAHLLSLNKNEAGGWVVEAQPEKGAYDVALAMIQKQTITEFPLTVVPVADPRLKALTPADFGLFLQERKNVKFPLFDLNGDGKHDNIDAYLFTASYVLNGGKKGPKAKDASATGKGKAGEATPSVTEQKSDAAPGKKSAVVAPSEKSPAADLVPAKKGKKSKAGKTGTKKVQQPAAEP